MMRREMRARRRLGANSRSTDVVVTPWADEYVPAPCADLPTYPPCHAGAGGRTYLPTPPLISEVGLPTMKKHKTLVDNEQNLFFGTRSQKGNFKPFPRRVGDIW